MFNLTNIQKISPVLWEITKSFRSDMKVPARIYATEKMLKEISKDRSIEQLINVATLPGIQKYALAMPDIHEGYGMPIGGIAAIDTKDGVISPGSVGYDINCGVRLLKVKMAKKEIEPFLRNLSQTIFKNVPSGVGQSGRFPMSNKDLNQILKNGAKQIVEIGYGKEEDLNHIESNGLLKEVDPELVSWQAKKRGHDQLGTMGAGNHFVEVGYIDTIFDQDQAKKFNLFKDQVTVLIHTGSRGLGHQVATDYIRLMNKIMVDYHIVLPDRELACAPFSSEPGQNYFKAMQAAANFAWANRQLITYEVRESFKTYFGENFDLDLIYDVAHNLAKIEEYNINGVVKKFIVHRKGATRSFPDQPVLIPGSIGTASYLLIGQDQSLEESFGSSCHGAGRKMSRTQAKKVISFEALMDNLNKKSITISAGSKKGLAEEAPEAYKNVDEVVEVVAEAGLAKKVVRLKPLAVIKG